LDSKPNLTQKSINPNGARCVGKSIYKDGFFKGWSLLNKLEYIVVFT